VRELEGVARGAEPWILDTDARLLLVRRLESQFPTLEQAGCKVGIARDLQRLDAITKPRPNRRV